MTEDKTFEKLSLLYQENAKVTAIFWEWRHKVMTHFLTGIGAIFVVAGWLYQQPKLGRFLSVPFLFGVVISTVSLILDWRNGEILRKCYSVGKEIELELRKEKGAIFEMFADYGKRNTYTKTLRATYISVGIIFLLLSILTLVFSGNLSA
jgi:cytochrome bd-type quinol oxidase subunit 1